MKISNNKNNDPKICCSVTGKTTDEILHNLQTAQSQLRSSDLLEIRADFIPNINETITHKIRNQINVTVIFTCRLHRFGGHYQGNLDSYLQLIKLADQLKFDYIDIDLDLIEQLSFKPTNSKIIASYHNFNLTPDNNKLDQLASSMQNNSIAQIYKIAVKSNAITDNQRLTKFLLKQKNPSRWIVIGMGEVGKSTRIIMPLLGSFLTFASIDDQQQSAPGQITYQQIRNIYQNFNLTKGNSYVS